MKYKKMDSWWLTGRDFGFMLVIVNYTFSDVESIERTSAGHIYHDSQDLDEKQHGNKLT